jgi:hypothetical protein
MEPLKPAARQIALARNPMATPEQVDQDLDEYQRLLANRFTRDPSEQPRALAAPEAGPQPQERLAELYTKLFGGSVVASMEPTGMPPPASHPK